MYRYYDHTEEKTEKVMLSVADLTIGMHVVELDRPWGETTFLFQGFVIGNNDDLAQLRAQCQYVYVEVTREMRASGKHKLSSPARRKDDVERPPAGERVQWVKKISFDQEITKARGSFDDARTFARNAMDALRMGMELDVEAAQATVKGCVESLIRNEDAMLFLLQIKNKDEYTAQHSMNVSTISAAFAMHLGHTQAEVEQAGLCGLLHDIGKVRVPEEILNKPGKLTPEEFVEMNKHPTYGRNILMGKAGLFRGAVDVAYSHHERLNGCGYPRKLEAHKVPYLAQLVGIADTYDALTSARCYKPGMSPHRAMDILNESKVSHFKAELIDEFTQWMGLYPPGSLVELNTGEVAIVVSVPSERSRLRPRVLVVLNSDKQPNGNEYVLNLDSRPTAPDGRIYQVTQGLACGSHGIDISTYMKKGAIAGAGEPQ